MITGKAKAYANQTLRAFVYDDYLTQKEIQIAKTQIDSAGNFKIFLPIAFTQFVFLKTEIARSSLYVEPNKNYFVSIPKLDAGEVSTIGVQAYAPLKINSSDSLELNNLLSKFEKYLDKFYSDNLVLIARKAIKPQAEKFKMQMQKRFSFSQNEYFKTYMKYKLGTLESAAGYGKKYIHKNYFGGTIQYKSFEYMQFFNQAFTKYLDQLSFTAKGAAIENDVNVKHNYPAVMQDILNADSLLKNDTLRELVLLKGLNEFYYHPKSNKKSVITLLRYSEKNGLGTENKKIAHNIISIITKMEEGTAAPAFELQDQNKKVVRLADFKGKYVYLDFWATWCLPCLQEMKVKQSLKEKYGNDIIFVSISLDKKFETMKSYLDKNKNLNSVFLFGGDSENIRELYNVKAIPTFYLIDRYGDLLKSPAHKPSENIENDFLNLSKKK